MKYQFTVKWSFFKQLHASKITNWQRKHAKIDDIFGLLLNRKLVQYGIWLTELKDNKANIND